VGTGGIPLEWKIPCTVLVVWEVVNGRTFVLFVGEIFIVLSSCGCWGVGGLGSPRRIPAGYPMWSVAQKLRALRVYLKVLRAVT